jgi:hypothetical protein
MRFHKLTIKSQIKGRIVHASISALFVQFLRTLICYRVHAQHKLVCQKLSSWCQVRQVKHRLYAVVVPTMHFTPGIYPNSIDCQRQNVLPLYFFKAKLGVIPRIVHKSSKQSSQIKYIFEPLLIKLIIN